MFSTGYAGFSRKNSDLSKITLWAQKYNKEKPLASHQFIFFDEENIVQALAKPGVVKQSWQSFLDSNPGVDFCILAPPVNFTYEQKIEIQVWLNEMIGWKYSIPELFLCLGDGIIQKIRHKQTIFFRYLGDIAHTKVICSKAANRPLVKIKMLPRDAYYFTPEDSYLYMLAHGWKVVLSKDWV